MESIGKKKTLGAAAIAAGGEEEEKKPFAFKGLAGERLGMTTFQALFQEELREINELEC